MPTWFPSGAYTSGWRQADEDQAVDIDSQIAARAVYTFRPADATALAALSSNYTLRAGDWALQVDIGVMFRWSGTAWVPNEPGTVGVIPSGVSGTSVSKSGRGKVSFTTATSVTISGCFSSTYDNYRAIFDITTTAAVDITVALGASVTGYDRTFGGNANSSFSGGTSLNQANLGLFAAGVIGETAGFFELYNPARAVATTAIAVAGTSGNPMVAASSGVRTQYWFHRPLTAYNDLVLAVSSGTMSGTVKIYGYS